jgi:hypothetical protein
MAAGRHINALGAKRFPPGPGVPIPKFVRICGTLGTNSGIEPTLEKPMISCRF